MDHVRKNQLYPRCKECRIDLNPLKAYSHEDYFLCEPCWIDLLDNEQINGVD